MLVYLKLYVILFFSSFLVFLRLDWLIKKVLSWDFWRNGLFNKYYNCLLYLSWMVEFGFLGIGLNWFGRDLE